jgi:hypothetical protein
MRGDQLGGQLLADEKLDLGGLERFLDRVAFFLVLGCLLLTLDIRLLRLRRFWRIGMM